MWNFVIPAVAGLAGDLLGASAARSGQAEANRTNLQIAREQMGFQREMSDTAWQRSVKDMKLAGVNPMLAFMKGGASTPPGATTRVESETGVSSQIMANSGTRLAQNLALGLQMKQAEASARKTNAEAALLEAEVPYSAGNAHTRSLKLSEELTRLGQDVEKASYEIRGLRMSTEQMEKMLPLLLEAQKLMNEGMRLQMSRKELESKAAEFLGIPFKYGGEAVKYLNELGSKIGQGAADAEDWVRSLPEKWNEMRREYHRNSEK